MVSKYRDRKINQSVLLVGNDIYTDATAKSNAKSAFDGNVVYNFETMVRNVKDIHNEFFIFYVIIIF
jgi:actin-related protein 5